MHTWVELGEVYTDWDVKSSVIAVLNKCFWRASIQWVGGFFIYKFNQTNGPLTGFFWSFQLSFLMSKTLYCKWTLSDLSNCYLKNEVLLFKTLIVFLPFPSFSLPVSQFLSPATVFSVAIPPNCTSLPSTLYFSLSPSLKTSLPSSLRQESLFSLPCHRHFG